MGDDNLVALRDQIDDGLGGLGDEGELLVGGVAEGVAAEGDDDSLAHIHAPYTLPIVATMTALMVCMRFSASSKTLEFGERKTSSVTSRIS